MRFTIVGDGAEREWLQRNMMRAEFTGVLRGEALAQAYAQMDIFAFPSETDTVGNVVLEAMASGVPAVVMSGGGPKFMVEPGRTAIVAADRDEFIHGVRTLVRQRERRQAMGAAARACAQDVISWDRIFLDVCGAYDAAIASTKVAGTQTGVLTSCS